MASIHNIYLVIYDKSESGGPVADLATDLSDHDLLAGHFDKERLSDLPDKDLAAEDLVRRSWRHSRRAFRLICWALSSFNNMCIEMHCRMSLPTTNILVVVILRTSGISGSLIGSESKLLYDVDFHLLLSCNALFSL